MQQGSLLTCMLNRTVWNITFKPTVLFMDNKGTFVSKLYFAQRTSVLFQVVGPDMHLEPGNHLIGLQTPAATVGEEIRLFLYIQVLNEYFILQKNCPTPLISILAYINTFFHDYLCLFIVIYFVNHLRLCSGLVQRWPHFWRP